MSSLALPREAEPRGALWHRLTRLFAVRGQDVLIAVTAVVFAVVLLARLASDVSVDTWLELVTGRLVWRGGVPHHDVLTTIALGHTWIDQQWLSQLAGYAIYLVGGIALLGLVNVALIVIPVAAATFAGRRFGASFRSVLIVLPAAIALIAPSREVRTQEFIIPLFVATTCLLAADSRAPSRRVFWCLPMLVLWANLHGTVTLGAGLVGLRAVTLAWDRRRDLVRSARAWRRPVALAVGAVGSILITPYGLSIIGYYRTTMVSSTLRQFVTEWQPVTTVPIVAVVLFLTAAVALWSFGRHPERTTLWEKLSLLILVAGGIEVVRNVLFCGLFALIVLPVSLGLESERRGAQAPDRVRGVVNGSLAVVALAALLVASVATLMRSNAQIEGVTQSPRMLATIERVAAADPQIRVLPDGHYADWLLWHDPALYGRVSNDASFELLTDAQLTSLRNVFEVVGTDWRQGARGYRLLVLNRSADGAAIAAFLREPGHRVLYSDPQRIVILRSARAAAAAAAQ